MTKIYHLAKLISDRGYVSPLCSKRPRKLNLRKELWTIRHEAVTCPKCLVIIKKHSVSNRGIEPKTVAEAANPEGEIL